VCIIYATMSCEWHESPIAMRSYLDKISDLKVGWNLRPLTEDDFYCLCRRHRLTVVEMPLETDGFYYCVKRRHYIAVDSRLPRVRKLLVMFHEFAHFLMHSPDTNTTASFHGVGTKTRKEREADAFALCALIPRRWVESRMPEELADEGFPKEIIRDRMSLYARLKI
jgi:Zn-dependent peptidase ImmA (M78 family)